MRYKYGRGVISGSTASFWVKMVYVVIGLLVGATAGLYVAAETLPPPHETIIYLVR